VGGSELLAVDVLDWDDAHPALQRLPIFLPPTLPHARAVSARGGSPPLFRSRSVHEEIPLAVTTTEGGLRTACFGFRFENLLGSDDVDFLLLFLDLLDWLSPRPQPERIVSTGRLLFEPALSEGASTLTDPRGRQTPREGSGISALSFPLVGEYRLDGKERSHRFFASLFDPTESDIARDQDELHRAGSVPGPPPRATSSPASRWLYLLAVGLLLAEWWLAARILT
jgi:hypothetical protein